MATHSSILAWEIAWTEESGRLQSMGSQEKSDTTEQLKNRQLIYLAAPGLSFRIWDLVPRPGDQTPVLGSSVESLATAPPGKSPAYSSLNGNCCLLPDTHLLETFVGLIVLASTVG